MTVDPKASIIIPTYMRPDKLKRAVDSVLSQSFENFEIIIINDGADCDLPQFCDDRITILVNKENKGANYSRNRGILFSTGELVAFLDDDDVWHEHKLQRQILSLESLNDDYGMVFTGATIVDSFGNIKQSTEQIQGDISQELLAGEIDIPSVTPLVRRECFAEVGLFDTKLRSSQDMDMWFRIAKNFEVKSIPEPLVTIFQNHQDRISEDACRTYQGKSQVLEKHYGDISDVPGLLGHYHYYLGVLSLYLSNHKRARTHFYKSYKESGISTKLVIHSLLSLVPKSIAQPILKIKEGLIKLHQRF